MNDLRFQHADGDALPTDDEPDRIVAAALAVFGEHGYADSSVADIARRADVPLSTVLHYFPSKDEIFREVVRMTLIGSLSARDDAAVLADAPSAVDAVRVLARRYWTAMEQPELAAIVRLVLGEMPRFPELAVFHATEALEHFVRTLERIIERGVARGELRPVDKRAAARIIVATVAAHAMWFAHPAIYGGIIGNDRERAVETTIETLVQSLQPVPTETEAAGR